MDQLITFASNHALLSIIWIALVVMIIVLTIKIQFSPIKQLSTHDATILMNKQSGVVVDIRSEKDYKSGHIIDAIHFSNDKVNKNDFASLEKHKDKPIIVVCVAGITASNAAHKFKKAGFDQVNVLKGGMNTWKGAGLPVTKK